MHQSCMQIMQENLEPKMILSEFDKNFKDITEKEILEKLIDVNKKYFLTNNPQVKQQLEIIKFELEEKYEFLKKQQNEFDNLIKIV